MKVKEEFIKGKRRGMLLCLLLIVLVIVSGCSEKKEKKDIRLEDTLGQELLSGVKFKDTLDTVDKDTVNAMYGLSDKEVSAFRVYMSTGATAEEIAIFRVENEENKEKVKKAIETRIEDQKTTMRDYLPNEMDKLDHPIIEENDHYVVLCITDDTEDAQKIIGKYF